MPFDPLAHVVNACDVGADSCIYAISCEHDKIVIRYKYYNIMLAAMLCAMLSNVSVANVYWANASSIVEIHSINSNATDLSVILGLNAAYGTGVVLDTHGIVVTNFHVVQNADSITISICGYDTAYDATILALDKENDLAILSTDAPTPSKVIISIDSPRIGDDVVVISNPGGLCLTLSDGIVSAFRMISNREAIQSTAPISHGSSGGGMFNMHGELVGVVFATGIGNDVTFAIPSQYVESLLNSVTK